MPFPDTDSIPSSHTSTRFATCIYLYGHQPSWNLLSATELGSRNQNNNLPARLRRSDTRIGGREEHGVPRRHAPGPQGLQETAPEEW
jgi:hypothetical protein